MTLEVETSHALSEMVIIIHITAQGFWGVMSSVFSYFRKPCVSTYTAHCSTHKVSGYVAGFAQSSAPRATSVEWSPRTRQNDSDCSVLILKYPKLFHSQNSENLYFQGYYTKKQFLGFFCAYTIKKFAKKNQRTDSPLLKLAV